MYDDSNKAPISIVQNPSLEELKNYSNAQYKTIVLQSKKITDLERKIEELEIKLSKAEQTNSINNVVSSDQINGATNDSETACLIQLALIRGNAMLAELTLEEVKKLEILTKTLILIKGKSEEKHLSSAGKVLTNEQLISLMTSNNPEQ